VLGQSVCVIKNHTRAFRPVPSIKVEKTLKRAGIPQDEKVARAVEVEGRAISLVSGPSVVIRDLKRRRLQGRICGCQTQKASARPRQVSRFPILPTSGSFEIARLLNRDVSLQRARSGFILPKQRQRSFPGGDSHLRAECSFSFFLNAVTERGTLTLSYICAESASGSGIFKAKTSRSWINSHWCRSHHAKTLRSPGTHHQ
jgi:hypothetical protein